MAQGRGKINNQPVTGLANIVADELVGRELAMAGPQW